MTHHEIDFKLCLQITHPKNDDSSYSYTNKHTTQRHARPVKLLLIMKMKVRPACAILLTDILQTRLNWALRLPSWFYFVLLPSSIRTLPFFCLFLFLLQVGTFTTFPTFLFFWRDAQKIYPDLLGCGWRAKIRMWCKLTYGGQQSNTHLTFLVDLT